MTMAKTAAETILMAFPFSWQCVNGHAAPIVAYGYEQDDDRQHLIRFSRCRRCHMPISGDEYVEPEEQAELYRKGII